jgi:DNA invertase Pin-like site-specific DNA recombinase
MTDQAPLKVTASHLERLACLYIRQSTLRQVFENRESTKRQYGLKAKALTLGWSEEQVCIIDCDLGQSGASGDREGFKQLVSYVGLGQVGIVMGLEVSRLARNSSDWQRLLEICALTRTLILDEDGIYDPATFNDRLLLGLKGTISEAELHVIRARLQGGLIAKARRGELKFRLPIGFVHDARDRIVLDPDQRVQACIQLFFDTFQRLGGAGATVREFHARALSFPRRLYSGPHKGEVMFGKLTLSRATQVLRNPRYSGAYVYGVREQVFRGLEQRPAVRYRSKDQWQVLIKDAHPGYISWAQYEANIQRLTDNCQRNGVTVPREGPALLQGIVVCGCCGGSMSVRYHSRRGKLRSADYCCKGPHANLNRVHCQSIPGDAIEQLIGELLLVKMQPAVLEVALQVQQELQTRLDEAGRIRYQHVEQARYEMDAARQRYLAIDPHNRLVAEELEAHWNDTIGAYRAAQATYEQQRAADQLQLSDQQQRSIRELCNDFPTVWNNPATPDRERKRMVRLLIEDVTLNKNDDIKIQIRFKGGATQSYHLPLPQSAWVERKHSPAVIDAIDNLLDEHTDSEVASILNERGMHSGTGLPFDARRVAVTRRHYRIPSRRTRLRKKGLLTITEICEKFKVKRWTVYKWRKTGKLKASRVDDVGRYLYDISTNITASTQEV